MSFKDKILLYFYSFVIIEKGFSKNQIYYTLIS